MNPKLRNMTSLYLVREGEVLCLYRIGSRVFSASRYIGSCGGHFEAAWRRMVSVRASPVVFSTPG